jgi:glycosyl transferase-like sugar-binding protein/alpha 1,4-glycosyltransferase
MDRILPVIQGLWIGGRLTAMERLCLTSFLKNGHECHLYTYADLENVPQDVIVKSAEDVVSRAEIFADRDEDLGVSYANFSDVFRYKLLSERGGVYADLDIVCLRPFDFQGEYVFGSQAMQDIVEETKRFGPVLVNGNVMKAPAGSEIMKFCYERSIAGASADREWFELGPPLLTQAIKKFRLLNYVQPHVVFNPVDWWNWDDVIRNEASVKTKLDFIWRPPVYAVHLWNSMWNRAGVDKNARFSPDCLYERLKQLYFNIASERVAND